MLSRVIALLFALVFSVSALAEADDSRSTGSSTISLFDTYEDAAVADTSHDEATAGERPLDDQPGQSLSEGAMDPPALMMARPDAKAPLLTMSRPRPYALAAWRAPYLDGPQRPPCAAAVSA